MAVATERANPYVGPRAYQAGERLYGRTRELAELRNLLIAKRLVLFYAPSGAGKSSLIQAALVPELVRRRFRVRPVVRVGTVLPAGVPAQTNRYTLSVLLALEGDRPAAAQRSAAELAPLSLATYLDRRTQEDGSADDVLIFDQFEEVLTLDPTDTAAKQAFFAGLADALQDRRRWALFTLREDYLAGLDPYRALLPHRLATVFRLDLLGPAAAQQAVQEPAQAAGVDFTAAAAAQLVSDLRRVQVQQPDGSSAEQPGPWVEPVQLQVVCRGVWASLAPRATVITPADLTGVGAVDTALARYYATQVAAVATATVAERRIRDWCEGQLITPSGIRGQVLRNRDTSGGLANAAVQGLVAAHLVRAEERRNAIWYELAHDRLIGPVRADNARWREATLQPWQRQAQLWAAQGQPVTLLLRGALLRDAVRWRATHTAESTSVEQDFLVASQAAEQSRQRNRRLALGGLALLLAALIGIAASAVVANNAAATSRHAEVNAENRRQEAVAAVTIAAQAQATAVAGSKIARAQAARAFAANAEIQLDKDNELSALLALEAVTVSQRAGDPVVPQAAAALYRALAQPLPLATLGHAGAVSSAAWSPDGTRIVTASVDRTAQVWDAVTGQCLATLSGHTDSVYSAAWSPDGTRIVTASADGTGRVWDAATGQSQATLSGHTAYVTSAAWSPDGTRIVTVSGDKTARVWDAATGQSRATFSGHTDSVTSAAWSPDGTRIVTASADGTAQVWDAATGQRRATLSGTAYVNSAAWSPDGTRIVTASGDGTARVWDAATGQSRATFSGHTGWVYSAVWSPDGTRIVTASTDKTARVWDATTGRSQATFGHTGWVTSAVWSPDGTRIVTASGDKTARVWDATTGQSQATLSGHTDSVYSAAWSPDGTRIVTASADDTARVWEAATGQSLATLGHAGRVFSAAWSPDGTRIVTASAGGTARVWNAATGQSRATFSGHTDSVTSAAWSPDGTHIVTASDDRTAQVWEAATGQRRATLLGHTSGVNSAAWSPDGTRIVTASADGTARVWNAATGRSLATLSGHTDRVHSAAWSPDGTRIVTSSPDGTARVWEAATGQSLATLGHTSGVNSAAWSPDGTRIVTASDDKTARVWDAATGQSLVTFSGHTDSVNSAAWSPDGTRIVTASTDRTAQVWDAATGQSQATLSGHTGQVNSAAWSPDGTCIVTAGADGTARIYPMDVVGLVALAQQRLHRTFTPAERATYFGDPLPTPTPATHATPTAP